MRVHISEHHKSRSWRPYDVKWGDFIEQKIAVPVVTAETFAVYKSLDSDEKQIYKDCGGYIFGSLRKNSRAKQNVIARNALMLDMDSAPLDVWQGLIKKFPFEMVLHSTHSHESSAPRFRLLVPLNRECTPDEYECVARTFAHFADMTYFDPTTFQPNRMMYFPSRAQDGEWVFEWQKGDWLNVDMVLSSFEDWTDLRSWYLHPSERKHEGTGQQRQHPHEAAGMIGTFNRTYSIHEAIEEFLSELYIMGEGGRYTYKKGSSALGGVTYEDIWFYSYHSTDPAQGRLLNAFELVMCHLHEDNIKRMTEFATTLPKVREMSIRENFSETSDEEGEEVEGEWLGTLEIDKSGSVVASDTNVKTIFENDPNLKDVFVYNDFHNNIFLSRPTTWRKDIPSTGDSLRNMDFPSLRTYMGLKYGLTNRTMIEENMHSIAYSRRYHPIREYLKGLVWDGTCRLETALIDYFDVMDNPYTREVFKRTLIGAVMRVLRPGCKHDTILVLVGQEGSAKSQFVARLGKAWFSDTFDMSRDKSVFEQLQGKWIIEIGEIDRMTRAEVGQVKNFTSKAEDSYRPAYGRVVEDFPRQCIFIGTTNEDTFLKSETGNRRFYPVQVRNGMFERGLLRSKKYVYTDLTESEVDQMWAEAYFWVQSGETNVLSKEATAVVDELREDYEEQDVLSGEIDKHLGTLVPENYDEMSIEEAVNWWLYPELRPEGTRKLERVCGVQLWVEILGRSRESYQRYQSLEMKSAIRKSKLLDATTSERIHTKRYGRQRCYKLKVK